MTLREFAERLKLLSRSGMTMREASARMRGERLPLRVPGVGKDSSLVLEPGRQITDPDEAERLGLTVEARRMREGRL